MFNISTVNLVNKDFLVYFVIMDYVVKYDVYANNFQALSKIDT